MMYAEVARHLDEQRRPVEAAWSYEVAYAKSEADHDLVLDLAAIYLLCQDPGFAAAHGISQEYANAASTRLFEVLDHAQRTFAGNAEVASWQLFARERIEFDDIDDSLYERFAVEGGSTLAMIRLHLSSGGRRFAQELRAAEARLKQTSTERARYQLSLLGSAALHHPS